jgi:hypothetical protein
MHGLILVSRADTGGNGQAREQRGETIHRFRPWRE